MLVHNVYFTLKEPTKANIDHLLSECKKYLTDHPGVTYFGCGTLADLDRPVNDRLFDVGLHVIFADRAAHDKYQVHERHVKFIEANKPTWRQVRVYDTDV
ncbi:MAG TPA: Dabb family protein [Pirellulales bacterium]|nr:Dabb family protein [Pirellulales bacterium]